MIRFFNNHPKLLRFNKILREEQSVLVEKLWETPKVLLAILALRELKKNVIFLTSGTKPDTLTDNFAYFGAEKETLFFPSWETLPGENIAPSLDISGRRIEILKELSNEQSPKIIICPLQAALQKLPNKQFLLPICRTWVKGSTIPFDNLPKMLTDLGYKRSKVASDKGEFAIRGGILDIFPVSEPDPYRIEFFGDTIDEIRIYDPVGQKSVRKADRVPIYPANEFDLLQKEKKPSLIFDYLELESLIILDDILELEDRFVSLSSLPAGKSVYFTNMEEFMHILELFPTLIFSTEEAEKLSEVSILQKTGRDYYTGENPLQLISFSALGKSLKTKRWNHPFKTILDSFSNNEASLSQDNVLQNICLGNKDNLILRLVSETTSEQQNLKNKIDKEQLNLPKQTIFDLGYLSKGFVLGDEIAVITSPEFTHRYKIARPKWRSTYHTQPSDFHELIVGDLVVHFHSGIGQYLGIEKRLDYLGNETEFMKIAYDKGGVLYTPVSQSYLVSKYIGSHEETPQLNTLGTKNWQRTKLKAQASILGYAKDLLDLHAKHALQGGFSCPPDGEEMQRFELDFPFVETVDQLNAIKDVKQDMMLDKTMDRLVCGDIGYGKTEVAMRAAFKAVMDGKKQVAFLAPTTILALQHYETFKERMANFPIRLGLVSRFQKPKEVKAVIEGVNSGEIDIIIGTHRILSPDVNFKDLGLIIIDEEQRFGVKAKERLRSFKLGVDSLYMSATPIPRTLYLALMGGKDISIISSPPQDRLPIKTIIAERDPEVIKNAFLRELSRGGQAYFVHNRVESIFSVASEIQKLVPGAKIVVGHGQMTSEELDIIFHSFKGGFADILVATTIIENGIDVPNANTIIVDRSTDFGLADLYQIRGRVGRWNKPAFAYFMFTPGKLFPEHAKRRLRALEEISGGYGGGMKIAMRDLEIRGSGDILGTQQSGHLASIGFHLYCKLLKQAINALSHKIEPTFIETKLEFPIDARITEQYMSETNLRLEFYHKFGEARDVTEIDDILSEMKDRFGNYPPQVIWLAYLTKVKILASTKLISSLSFKNNQLTIEFMKDQNEVRKTITFKLSNDPNLFLDAIANAIANL